MKKYGNRCKILSSKKNTCGIIYILSGSSGAGKTTIENLLLKRCCNLKQSISATTRPMRNGEKDGRDYRFLSFSEFNHINDNGGFLESARVYDNFYGTPKQDIDINIANGFDVILTIDIQGAKQVKAKIDHAVSIFIIPPSIETLLNRLNSRNTDSSTEIAKRTEMIQMEIQEAFDYDYLIVMINLMMLLNLL